MEVIIDIRRESQINITKKYMYNLDSKAKSEIEFPGSLHDFIVKLKYQFQKFKFAVDSKISPFLAQLILNAFKHAA